MEEIILSFKPEFFRALLTKKKHFEYRSRIPKEQTTAYLYLSAPAKMIVGKLVLGKRNDIKTALNDSDVSHEKRLRLQDHYREGAHSFSLLDKPISLDEARRLSHFYAPQGYSYMKHYPELHNYLRRASYSTFDINHSESLELLGLFTKDIVEQFQQEIASPPFIETFL